jgi:hypothetical protein
MKDEALDLALEALECFDYPAHDDDVNKIEAAITAIKQALAAQPAPVQDLPFGVGGGLVAIKTLLSRDPCVHANTAIEMIDAILKEHTAAPPAAQRPFVGLTDEEILKLAYPIRWQEVDDFEADKAVNFAQAIEAKLKEKNNG